jgi:hypothetical protein
MGFAACRASPYAVDRNMAKDERGGQGPRTTPVTIEEPVMVPMSDADRAAAVSVLAEILTAWWTKHATEGQVGT